MLHNAAVSFIWKKKMGTGSGVALLCGFRVVQARAAREERQTQQSRHNSADNELRVPELAPQN